MSENCYTTSRFLYCPYDFIFLDDISRKIAHKHIDVILRLNETNLKETFQHFSDWINEGVDELKFPKDLYNKVGMQ